MARACRSSRELPLDARITMSRRASRDIKFRVLIIGMDVFPAFALGEQMQERPPSCSEYVTLWEDYLTGSTRPYVEPTMHDIEDELTFINHDDYIFRDSRGEEEPKSAMLVRTQGRSECK